MQEFFPFLIWMLELSVLGFTLAGLGRAFRKAGEPSWAAFVPVYNVYVFARVGDAWPGLLVLLLVPVINLFAALALAIGFARRFQRGNAFGFGLLVLPFVLFPVLGFGAAQPTPSYTKRGRS